MGQVATSTKVTKKRKGYRLYNPSQCGLNSIFSLGSLPHYYPFPSAFILYSNIVVSHFVSVGLEPQEISTRILITLFACDLSFSFL